MTDLELETDLEARLEKAVNILAAVSRQPVKLWEKGPSSFDGKLDDELPFEANLHLGDEYKIHFWHVLKKDNHPGIGEHWGVDDYGYEIKDKEGKVLARESWGSSEHYTTDEISEDKKVIDRSRLNFLLRQLDRIEVYNPAFMDYERYTIESLKGDDSYFSCVYLTIMCDLREKGMQMPPILSKQEHIRIPMMKGDIESVKAVLDEELVDIASRYDKACLEHAKAEADEIKRFTQKKNQYHDKNIPLIEKFPRMNVSIVPGNNAKRKYNLLVVEDFGSLEQRINLSNPEDFAAAHQGTVGRLSKKLLIDLAKTGKYGGTNIFNTVNICDCMTICGTGQVDIIIMDGGYDNMAAAQKLMQSIGGDLTVCVNGKESHIPKISGYSEKKQWQKMIYAEVEKNGHTPPPCTIVPSNIMDSDVAMLIDSMLKQEDPFKEIKEKLQEKHIKERQKAFELERKAAEAAGDVEYKKSYFSPSHRADMERMDFEQHISYAKRTAKIGEEMTLDQFTGTLYCLIEQNIPLNLETAKPFEVMKGLQAIEVVLSFYPQYAKDERVINELEGGLGKRLSCAANAMQDTGYYLRAPNRMRAFMNALSCSYLIVENLKTQEHLKEVSEQMKILEPDFCMERVPLNQFVENNMLSPILTIASDDIGLYSPGKFDSPETRFLVGYGRRLAKLAGCRERFDKIYLQRMGFESLMKQYCKKNKIE